MPGHNCVNSAKATALDDTLTYITVALNRISNMSECSVLPLGVQEGSMQRMAEPPQDHLGLVYSASLFLWQYAAQYQRGSLKGIIHCYWSAITE